jgi:predicted metal-dependent hydrolase
MSDTPPDCLYLRAIEETWQIVYSQTNTANTKRSTLTAQPLDKTILIKTPAKPSLDHYKQLLSKWLKNKAKLTLLYWLDQLSLAHDLPFAQANTRSQKTLWGSCNHKKNISLNCKLLFLPENLAKHVILHELCHTKHLNHSARFWKLLNKFDPQTKQHNQALKTADNFVPKLLVT